MYLKYIFSRVKVNMRMQPILAAFRFQHLGGEREPGPVPGLQAAGQRRPDQAGPQPLQTAPRQHQGEATTTLRNIMK